MTSLLDKSAEIENAILDFEEYEKQLLKEDDSHGFQSSLVTSQHPLDDPNFNALRYVNTMFPTEASLDTVDSAIHALKEDIRDLDEHIFESVRYQASHQQHAQKDLELIQNSIASLQASITNLKERAVSADEAVKSVCDDIKVLHWVKQNLTNALSALKRLTMLVTALDQLRVAASQRSYEQCANLLLAIEELSLDSNLRELPNVAELYSMKEQIRSDLRQQILEDFDSIFDPDTEMLHSLKSACSCVDAMSATLRREICIQFCLKILEAYKSIFQPPQEFSSLMHIERRFAWLRRALHEYQQKFKDSVFPGHWNIEQQFAEHFCHITRQHIVEVLGTEQHSIPPVKMVQILRQTFEFEESLVQQFGTESVVIPARTTTLAESLGSIPVAGQYARDENTPVEKRDEAEPIPQFKGILTDCFEPYLGLLIRDEEKSLSDQLMVAISPEKEKIIYTDYVDDAEGNEEATVPKLIYSSAVTLFAAISTSLNRIASLSTNKKVVDVLSVFKRILQRYARILRERAVFEGSSVHDDHMWARISVIMGTCDYGDATMSDLEDAVLAKFNDVVEFDAERDLLWQAKAACVQHLTKLFSDSLSVHITRMKQADWCFKQNTLETESNYIRSICDTFDGYLRTSVKHFSTPLYRFTYDKLAQTLLTIYASTVSTKLDLDPHGAQQIIVDCQYLQSHLVNSSHGSGSTIGAGLVKFIHREIEKIKESLKARMNLFDEQ